MIRTRIRGRAGYLGRCLGLAGLIVATAAHAELKFANVGAEFDDESGSLVSAALAGDFAPRTSWDLAIARSDSATDPLGLSTTAYDASMRHDFGKVGLRVGFGDWSDADYIDAQKFFGALDFQSGSWNLALQVELRDSDFEPFDIDRTIIRRDGTPVTIVARAHCAIDDTGLGARLSFLGEAWSFEIGGMSYDYDDPTCDFNLRALDFLRQSTRDEFVQFADRLTNVLALGAGSRILADTSLLDSRLGLALSYDAGPRTYNVYYDRLEDVFFGLKSDTLSGGLSLGLRSGNEIEVYVGATDRDGLASVAFVGFSLYLIR